MRSPAAGGRWGELAPFRRRPRSHAQCSSINETTMAVACLDGSGSVAFGPDPATAWHATLTGAEYVRLGVSSGVGGGFDNSSNDLAVAFRFSPLDRKHTEKLRHHLRVYEQEVKFKLTTNVKAWVARPTSVCVCPSGPSCFCYRRCPGEPAAMRSSLDRPPLETRIVADSPLHTRTI